MPEQKPHLSYSQLDTLLHCPRAYWYSRVVKVPTRTASALFVGSREHDALEHNFRQKIKSDSDLSAKQVQEVFADTWDKKLKEDDVRFNAGESAESLKDAGLTMLATYMREVAPHVHPLYVEYPARNSPESRLSLGVDFPFVLVAHFDVVERDPANPDQPAGPSDHKFYSAYRFSRIKGEIDSDLQLTIYALAYRLLFKRIEKTIHLNVVDKSPVPRAARFPTIRTEHQIRWVLGAIEQAARMIRAQAYPPNTNGWKHSPKWCDFWADCMESNSPLWRTNG